MTSVLICDDIVFITVWSNTCSFNCANVTSERASISAKPIVVSNTPLCALANIVVAFVSLVLNVPSISNDNIPDAKAFTSSACNTK